MTNKYDPQQYQTPAISVNGAAKKYGVPQTTLSRWAAKGRLRVLKYPERPGQKMLVDETSVVAAIELTRRYLPRNNQGQQPLPLRYCPYCGKPLPY